MIKQYLSRIYYNLPGWRTNRKIVVIESDDWGSIRMPSKEAFNNLQATGIDLLSDEGFRFNKYDSLATSADLELLFEVSLKLDLNPKMGKHKKSNILLSCTPSFHNQYLLSFST